MNIQGAVDSLRNGRYIAREKWGHGNRTYLRLGLDDLIYVTQNGIEQPYVIPHDDLLAEDWIEVIPHP